MTTDVLYVAWNRLEFTRFSFETLVRNTDWGLVDRLVVYDDGSSDGTFEYLDEMLEVWYDDGARYDSSGVEFELRRSDLRSPPAIMNDYLGGAAADVFAKVDNDIAMPSGWLGAALDVFAASPELDLLGLAAGWTGVKEGAPGWESTSHIGGVGLMRADAFRRRAPLAADGRHGFTHWQEADDGLARGWITPDVLAVQLDLVPAEPWRSLSEEYISRGWQRRWPPYEDPTLWRWIEEEN